MDAAILTITVERSCSARLSNDIVLVFAEPKGHTLQVGDRLRFDDLRLGRQIRVLNQTQGVEFYILLASRNVHDLHVPAKHGGSRTPTPERLLGP
jgi:hypothetical protein